MLGTEQLPEKEKVPGNWISLIPKAHTGVQVTWVSISQEWEFLIEHTEHIVKTPENSHLSIRTKLSLE